MQKQWCALMQSNVCWPKSPAKCLLSPAVSSKEFCKQTLRDSIKKWMRGSLQQMPRDFLFTARITSFQQTVLLHKGLTIDAHEAQLIFGKGYLLHKNLDIYQSSL